MINISTKRYLGVGLYDSASHDGIDFDRADVFCMVFERMMPMVTVARGPKGHLAFMVFYRGFYRVSARYIYIYIYSAFLQGYP